MALVSGFVIRGLFPHLTPLSNTPHPSLINVPTRHIYARGFEGRLYKEVEEVSCIIKIIKKNSFISICAAPSLSLSFKP